MIIPGQSDSGGRRLVTARSLFASYAGAASAGGGHAVRSVAVAELAFPWLQRSEDWADGEVPPAICASQTVAEWAEHPVIVVSLWPGDIPAVL